MDISATKHVQSPPAQLGRWASPRLHLLVVLLCVCMETSQAFLALQTTARFRPVAHREAKLCSFQLGCRRCPAFVTACERGNGDSKDQMSEGTATLLRQAPPQLPPLRVLVPACVGSWLLAGTLFFHFHTGWPYQQAFFFAVDTGLSIGFGSIGVTDAGSRLFTLAHVLFGAGVAGAGLALYTDTILTRSNQNFVKSYARLTEDDAEDVAIGQFEDMKGPLAFVAWVGVGVAYGMAREGWDPVQSLYFAVAAMATGGLESPSVGVGQETNAVLVGLYSLFGVPIFAYNLGNVASFFEGLVTRRREIEALVKRMSKEEFDIAAGIVSPDAKIDRAEFVVLELIRLDKVDAPTVDLILKRFNMLDKDQDGYLTPTETYLRAPTPKLEIPPDWSDQQ